MKHWAGRLLGLRCRVRSTGARPPACHAKQKADLRDTGTALCPHANVYPKELFTLPPAFVYAPNTSAVLPRATLRC